MILVWSQNIWATPKELVKDTSWPCIKCLRLATQASENHLQRSQTQSLYDKFSSHPAHTRAKAWVEKKLVKTVKTIQLHYPAGEHSLEVEHHMLDQRIKLESLEMRKGFQIYQQIYFLVWTTSILQRHFKRYLVCNKKFPSSPKLVFFFFLNSNTKAFSYSLVDHNLLKNQLPSTAKFRGHITKILCNEKFSIMLRTFFLYLHFL